MTYSELDREISFAVEPLPPLEALAAAWTRLDAVGTHSFFLTWTWIGTWLRCIPQPPYTMLLRATRGDETIALAVVSLKRTTWLGVPVRQAWLNMAGDPAYDCVTLEHNGFASSGVRTDELWEAFEKWFAHGNSLIDELVLAAISPEICGRGEFFVQRRETGFRTPMAKFSTLEGFMSCLSRNSRQQLRRSFRAYEHQAAVTIDFARDTETALSFFAEMKALHIRSWTRRQRVHAFSNPFFETFHRSLIRGGAATGRVDLLRVSAGDRVVGFLYNFLHNGTVSSYQSGFDDSDRHLRPGYVCHALAIAHYAAAGMSSYDFLAGTNPLKTSFGPERYELCWHQLRAKTLSSLVAGKMRRIHTNSNTKESRTA